ncbi:D-amino-acid transaminase, chloroplastic isoform X2 [Helianthus annuus]|uniref:D-amino-acid transaminase, chloroplastic isoform X2 n=1 Tax=Helianthus annuus TaxID=4232 RepID=UPI001652C397|nr:D-amino-acid transaminase, chloroplastic isoform X2 [Helianthus annuus]XP_035837736.1 D-amino-acid transaminase, chloroplastic isoform X2 [Helianthus annuus]
MKVLFFSTSKNVNYLQNVLLKLEVEEKGALASIWVDDDEYVAEHPNVNVGFVTHEKELILPFFDKILSGCTAKRLLELAPKLVEKGRLKSLTVGNITVEEAKQAAEMMYTGRTIPVLPIIEWDEKPIGDVSTARVWFFQQLLLRFLNKKPIKNDVKYQLKLQSQNS